MPIIEKLRSLFSGFAFESAPIVVSATARGDKLPSGFFISIGTSGRTSLGFHCTKCGFEVRHGAEVGVVHCGRRERAPDAAQRESLPKVKWDFPHKGQVRLPDGSHATILDTSEWECSGEVEWVGDWGKRW